MLVRATTKSYSQVVAELVDVALRPRRKRVVENGTGLNAVENGTGLNAVENGTGLNAVEIHLC